MTHLGYVTPPPFWPDEVRREAYVALLEQPDPPDLRGIFGGERRYSYRCGGSINREALKVQLEQAWLRHRVQEAGKDGEGIISVRKLR